MKKFVDKINALGLRLKVSGNDLVLAGKNGELKNSKLLILKERTALFNFIKENKKELINYLNKETTSVSNEKLDRKNLASLYELSPLQEGILFHSLYNDTNNSTAYHTQFIVEFSSPIDMVYFRKAWEEVIENHSILRTGFIHENVSIPLQFVNKKVDLPVSELDYSELTSYEFQVALEKLAKTERLKKFNFNAPPLIRIVMVKKKNDKYTMIWTKHHILWDGWSGQIVIKEVFEAYHLLIEGKNLVKRQEDCFKEFIDHIKNIDSVEEARFWKNYLVDYWEPALVPFVGGTAERNMGHGTFKEETLSFGEDFTEKLVAFGKRIHLTTNTVIQGVWSILLSQYSGQDDVVFGVTVSGRPPEQKYDTKVGLFINTIPFRAVVKNDKLVEDWLLELQKGHVEARKYQHSSLNKIKQWGNIKGDFFDSLLLFNNYPIATSEAPINDKAIQIESVKVSENNNYLLSIESTIRQQLNISFKYNSQFLETAYVEMIKDHFKHVLGQIISQKNGRLDEITLSMSEVNKNIKILQEKPLKSTPFKGTILDLFLEQLTLNPEAFAVADDKERLTYKALDEQATALALDLEQKGVRKGTLVAILLHRSVEMIVGILGVLKLGAAYVPIDPDAPVERVNYILDDIKTDWIICDSNKHNSLKNKALSIIEVDLKTKRTKSTGASMSKANITASELAYVIYTSGSTGKPKGVMITHGNVTSFFENASSRFYIDENIQRVAATTSYTFDISVLELLGPLCQGKEVYMFHEEALLSPELFLRLLEEQNIDWLQLTPSRLKQLQLETPKFSEALKVLLVGGEALDNNSKNKVIEYNDRLKLINVYGPTETTIWSSSKVLHLDEKISIGHSLKEEFLYVLSEDLKRKPIGVPGELCISGAGVGKGYLNLKELTKEKFISNPFLKGEHLYKTGDIARYLPSGEIEFIGRKDNQVKIRGHRIELGEIESILENCPLVRRGIVVSKKDRSGNSYLVSYVVPEGTYNKEGIQSYLRNYLPDYMIPAIMMKLNSIALMVNGKVDMKALPEPDISDLRSGVYLPASNHQEKVLVTIWEDLLALNKIGIEDNFFELGADSLVFIRAISAIQKEFNLKISIQIFFKHRTIKKLAAYLSESINAVEEEKQEDASLYNVIDI